MSFTVSLGIMPDYAFDGDGMRIDAVTDEDGPASRAGLQEEDVIVRLGDTEVDDIYAYMEALNTLKPGDTATIVVQRSDRTLERTVRF
jgi:S1-C subfamily serine protease